MNWDELYDVTNEPSFSDMKAFIKSDLWDDLNEYLKCTYKIEPKVTYSKCSAQRGWNVKYQKSSRSLCTLYPMDGYYIALIVIGAKEEPETELMLRTFSGYMQELYSNTPFSCGGRWLMIKIDNADVLNDTKTLISIRVKPKK